MVDSNAELGENRSIAMVRNDDEVGEEAPDSWLRELVGELSPRDVAPQAALAVGIIVDRRYRIEAAIGAGGMGAVYRARDLREGADVALKVVRADPSLYERFAREARTLAALTHPGIVRYLGDGALGDGSPYLVMEWLEGSTLAARLARGPLGLEASLTVAREIAKALAHLHGAGVLHRDIKPSNIVLTDDGRVVLVDFGIAKLTTGWGRLTRTGASVGTVGYMAPEQARGDRRITAQADLFSLGCVLYECLSGRPAFAGANAIQVAAKLLAGSTPPLAVGRPSAEQLVARLLALNPADRPEGATEVEAALGALIAESAGTAGEPARRERRPRRARWAWVALAMGLGVGLAVTAARWSAAPTAPSVLWVDDHPEGNEHEIRGLEARGFRVVTARSFAEATADAPFDSHVAIISDMGRLEPSGYEQDAGLTLIRRVREAGASTPIVIYTAPPMVAPLEPEIVAAGGTGITGSSTELIRLIVALSAPAR